MQFEPQKHHYIAAGIACLLVFSFHFWLGVGAVLLCALFFMTLPKPSRERAEANERDFELCKLLANSDSEFSVFSDLPPVAWNSAIEYFRTKQFRMARNIVRKELPIGEVTIFDFDFLDSSFRPVEALPVERVASAACLRLNEQTFKPIEATSVRKLLLSFADTKEMNRELANWVQVVSSSSTCFEAAKNMLVVYRESMVFSVEDYRFLAEALEFIFETLQENGITERTPAVV